MTSDWFACWLLNYRLTSSEAVGRLIEVMGDEGAE